MPYVTVGVAVTAPLVFAIVAWCIDPSEAHEARAVALAGRVDAVRIALLTRSAPPVSCASAEPCWPPLPAPDPGEALWIVGAAGDFAVHGLADIDGDGTSIEFVATRDLAATRWTPPDVL